MKQQKRKGERGSVLIASYLVLAVLGVYSAALYSQHFTVQHAHERSQNLIEAFHLADAGVDRALVELRKDTAYPGQGYTSVGTGGGYEVLVTTPDPLYPLVRRVVAIGYVPENNPTSPAYVRREILSYVSVDNKAAVPSAIFGCSDVEISGSPGPFGGPKVDSYSSSVGYDPSNPGSQGDLGTNSVASDTVKLSGKAVVKGDVFVGPGGDPNEVVEISGSASLEGETSAASQPVSCSDVEQPAGVGSQGKLQLSGKESLELAGGTYLFDSISITSQAQLKLTGSATIYVQGDVNIAGNGVVTQGNLPKNLVIKVIGDQNVEVKGSKDFYGVLYAPLSEAKVSGDAQVFGAVFASSYEQSGNSQLHFDEDLKDIPVIETGLNSRILSWQEV